MNFMQTMHLVMGSWLNWDKEDEHSCHEQLWSKREVQLRMCGTVRDKKCIISHLMLVFSKGMSNSRRNSCGVSWEARILCDTATVKPKRRGRSLLYRTTLKLENIPLWFGASRLMVGILYNLALSPHESYFESHAIRENGFEKNDNDYLLTMTLVHVWTVFVKTIKKYGWAK